MSMLGIRSFKHLHAYYKKNWDKLKSPLDNLDI
jgi:hypothetical protein